MLLFDTKFFCAKTKFTLAELRSISQSLTEDLNACVRRFHEKSLGYCNLVAEEVLGDEYFHDMMDE